MKDKIREISDTIKSELEKTDEIIASSQAIAEQISEVNDTLASGFTMLSAGLQELCFVTRDGFREIADRLDLQSKTLEAIKEILERPLDTLARELRRRAEVAYLNNWFDEAEMDLLEAEKKNYQDFIVHQILGNIYYYYKSDYPKAIEYYQKVAKYAAPVSKKHATNALICAGIVYYKLGQVSDSYKSTGAALELLPEDPHVLYQHARYTAKMGYEFTDLLRKCVYKDPTYLITVDRDDMFSSVKEKIKKLAKDLKDEKWKIVNKLTQVIDLSEKEKKAIEKIIEKMGYTITTIKGLRLVSETFNISIFENQLAIVKELCSRNSWLDIVEAEQVARNVALKLKKILYGKGIKGTIKKRNKNSDYLIGLVVLVIISLIIIRVIIRFLIEHAPFILVLLLLLLLIVFSSCIKRWITTDKTLIAMREKIGSIKGYSDSSQSQKD